MPVSGRDARVHVLFELGDHLGSTSVVLDQATGELVEKSSFFAYGAAESDYRPERWDGSREDYRFTGKEEDVEVGLVYFGKRFLNPLLGRWVSPDPLGVHAPSGENPPDLNLYAYVRGQLLKSVDPIGLREAERQNRRETIVMLSGNGVDGHLRAMDNFARSNYGKPGATGKSESKQPEKRMVLGSSGVGVEDMLVDLTRAAKRLGSSSKKSGVERSIQVVAHGGPGGIGREEVGEYLEYKQLQQMVNYKNQRDKAYGALIDAINSGDEGRMASATAQLENLTKENAEMRHRFSFFQKAAAAMEKAQVDYVELQACSTATRVGTGAHSFNSYMSQLLSTSKHKVEVLGHADSVDTQPRERGGPVTVSVGGSRGSTTTFPQADKQ